MVKDWKEVRSNFLSRRRR